MASATKISLDNTPREQLAPLRFHKIFLAIIPPHHIIKELQALQLYFQQDHPGRYVEFNNLHCTLVYIGPVEESMLSSIKKAALNVQVSAFDAHISSISLTQNTQAKMLWANLEKESISPIIEALENALIEHAQLKFEKKHEIKPHVTLARLSKENNTKDFEPVQVNFTWAVDTIIALESVQNALGQVHYKQLFSITLR